MAELTRLETLRANLHEWRNHPIAGTNTIPLSRETVDEILLELESPVSAIAPNPVMVPREPTEAMQRAGAEYANYDDTEREAEHDSDAAPDHIDMFVAARVYRAMVSAAPQTPDYKQFWENVSAALPTTQCPKGRWQYALHYNGYWYVKKSHAEAMLAAAPAAPVAQEAVAFGMSEVRKS